MTVVNWVKLSPAVICMRIFLLHNSCHTKPAYCQLCSRHFNVNRLPTIATFTLLREFGELEMQLWGLYRQHLILKNVIIAQTQGSWCVMFFSEGIGTSVLYLGLHDSGLLYSLLVTETPKVNTWHWFNIA